MCGGGKSTTQPVANSSNPNGMARPPAAAPMGPLGSKPNGMAARPEPAVQPAQPVAKTRVGSVYAGGR